MMLPLLHHGMVISGIPYTESALSNTQSGGTPYGASHVSSHDSKPALTAEENDIAFAQGKRLAELARKLADWLPCNKKIKAVWKPDNAGFQTAFLVNYD